MSVGVRADFNLADGFSLEANGGLCGIFSVTMAAFFSRTRVFNTAIPALLREIKSAKVVRQPNNTSEMT